MFKLKTSLQTNCVVGRPKFLFAYGCGMRSVIGMLSKNQIYNQKVFDNPPYFALYKLKKLKQKHYWQFLFFYSLLFCVFERIHLFINCLLHETLDIFMFTFQISIFGSISITDLFPHSFPLALISSHPRIRTY